MENNSSPDGPGYVVDKRREMEAFDRLPVEIRRTLDAACGCYSAHEVEAALRGGLAVEHVLAHILRVDAQRYRG